jgi:hypothetical protein
MVVVDPAAVDNGSTDNCLVAGFSLDIDTFGCDEVGTNNVVLTVTDASGNTATAPAIITVLDDEVPQISVQNITVFLDVSGSVSITGQQVNNNSTDNCSIASYSLDVSTFTCADIGENTVTLTIADPSGNTNDTTAIVTVEDNLLPEAIAQDITVTLDASGVATITAADIDNGSFDNCGIASRSLDVTSFSCSDLGVNTVTLTVIDVNGNSSTAMATVTVDGGLTITINPIVFLQGPIDNPTTVGLMNDNLRANNLIPNTSPYSDGIMTTAPVLSITGADAIVDWVWVELRDSADKTVVVEGRSALLQRDGNIVDIDGTSAINFNVAADNYYLLIQHRNHLSIFSASAVVLCRTTTVDLSSDPLDVFGGSNAVANMGSGLYALYGGDFNGDGQILNTDITGVLPLSGTSGYSNGDVNMDGQILNTDIQLIIQPNSGRGIQH